MASDEIMNIISIDFYGTLDKESDFWLKMLEYWKIEGFKIYVMGGNRPKALLEELEHNGYSIKTHFDDVVSVLSHVMDSGKDVWYSEEQDSWRTDPADWWASKAVMCERLKCSVHFDNDIRFLPAFKHVATRFVYLRWEDAQTHLVEWAKELQLANTYDDWEDDYMYMSGVMPM